MLQETQIDSALPSVESIEEVLKIVDEATREKRPLLKTTTFEQKMERMQRWLFAGTAYAAILMLTLAALGLIAQLPVLRESILAAAATSQIFGLLMLIVGIVGALPFLWTLRKSVYNPFLDMVRISSAHDLAIITKLLNCQDMPLQYVLMQYKQERNGYERRTGMINGSIEKIGVFPALAALALLISNLLKVDWIRPWVSYAGLLLLVFMLLSMTAAHMLYKMDRVIAMLEFVLQMKKMTAR